MNRKLFLQRLSAGTAGLVLTNKVVAKTAAFAEPLSTELVKNFVIAGHGKFEAVKNMLVENPTLLYATYDWGGGDFETALEGAGHIGNKEIANYLIGLGARTNIFVLTMLGKTETVKSFLNQYPAFINAKGPHGLTLLHHAQKGGEDAKELLSFFQSKGLKETKVKL